MVKRPHQPDPTSGAKRLTLRQRIPIRGSSTINEKTGSSQASPVHADLSLHPVAAKEALIVKVTPPHVPAENIHHVACDIVLVIDVSGSMGAPADVPGEVESTGLSVLDLTKHAAMTIIETLNESDRLGIVTFGSRSRVVLTLTSMTDTNKDLARKKVKEIESRDATNLWHGMLDGIRVLRQGMPSNRVPALMILTDGKPNHMCPEQGYIPKLRSMPPLPASVHTFGFGYSLESGLLKSIAEFGGGNYAFIPDAGMIGTVFVHAVANLQSTFATKAVLTLSYQEPLSLEEIGGDYIGRHAPEFDGSQITLTMELGNLQYGQTRDIYILAKGIGNDPFDEKGVTCVTAHLEYFPSGGKPKRAAHATCSMLADSELSPNEIAYHESRTLISKFLSSIFPANVKSVYQAIKHEQLKAKVAELPELIKELPAQKFDDVLNQSLVEDLAGEEPRGQISIALRTPENFRKWGIHYLPSIHNAHTRQICNSFKDPGPLQYGAKSPLFLACRDRLDNAFDELPAPEPSAPHLRYATSSSHPTSNHPFSNRPFSMSRYHNPMGSCFAGSTPVELASGRRVAIRKLRRGVKVRTPAGVRKVAVVLKTPVTEETMCQVKGGILVTPWHPIAGDSNAKAWGFPAYVTERNVRYTGFVYSVMLQRGDGNPKGHAMRVGDVWGVTLGHGIVSGNDSRAHAFFGDYRRVAKAFLGMGIDKAGVVVGAGVERDTRTGVVSGFRQPPPLLDQECVVS
ncbi:unnamed protein product [Clonostachys rosea]|uniref:VWFA domain-containing protein n=1 Tax=Bionectria ochroleuca TaxID=29856 RepID=A0ABY6V5N5_BIOOC|nr:unnamed protein product [Clonostachys rosea]